MRPFSRCTLLTFLSVCLISCASPSAKRSLPRVSTEKTLTQQIENEALNPSVLAETPAQKAETPAEEKPVQKGTSPTVRILLGENLQETTVEHNGRVNIYTADGSEKYKLSNGGKITLKSLQNGKIKVGTLTAQQAIIIEPVNAQLTWNQNTYTGRFYVVPVSNNKFNLVEHVALENYLYGVLPYEMSPSWPLEALKAQAVAARTYTLKTLENVKTKTFDLYSDVRSQMYKGTGKRYDNVTKAVDQTRGEVLMYNKKLFFTYYHGNCGGGTDDVKSWNFKVSSIKPLSGTSCKFDSHSKSYEWTMNVPREKVESYLRKAGLNGTVKTIKPSSKTSTGRAIHLIVHTSKGAKTVPCGEFRLATGIRSCKLTHIKVNGHQVRFEGRGYGHGIGMCQDGANGMAKEKHSYKEILKHYYPGSTLTKIK